MDQTNTTAQAQVEAAEFKKFIDKATQDNMPIAYLMDNPKQKKSESYKRYTNYSVANNFKEMIGPAINNG